MYPLKPIGIYTIIIIVLSLPGSDDVLGQQLDRQQVELPIYNCDMQIEIDRYTGGGPTIPRGFTWLNGIPFDLPAQGNSCWHAGCAGGANPRVLEILTDIPNPMTVYTLMNTAWGIPEDKGTFASLEFHGSAGAYYPLPLYGNVQIRDFNQSCWTNSTVAVKI